MFRDDTPGLIYDAILDPGESGEHFVSPNVNPDERVVGDWLKMILDKTNLAYVSGYSFGGPDYIYKDKKGRRVPCEIEPGKPSIGISQLTRYIKQYDSPLGILVLAGSGRTYRERLEKHGIWPPLPHWAKDAVPDKILVLLTDYQR